MQGLGGFELQFEVEALGYVVKWYSVSPSEYLEANAEQGIVSSARHIPSWGGTYFLSPGGQDSLEVLSFGITAFQVGRA